MANIYIGIDPGVSGGIAAVSEAGILIGAWKMPDTERDLLDKFMELQCDSKAVLEYVRAMPRMGVASMFAFGRGYGAIRMALVASEIPFDEVTPQKWQRAMACLTKGDKNISKGRAQELFPKIRVTHAIADALLLSEYARRFNTRTS